MAKGKIVELYNNYGMIVSDAYKTDEWIPFLIKRTMLEEREGRQYIKYTEEVEFSFSQRQGVRDRDIREATDVRFVGTDWMYQERTVEKNEYEIIKKRLDDYNFFYPSMAGNDFLEWLRKNNFQSRMMEYMSPGIFTSKELLRLHIGDDVYLEKVGSKFKVGLLFVIDRIDIEFRKHLLSWITGIENAYKEYFNRIRIYDGTNDIGTEVISRWLFKKAGLAKVIKRARAKRLYRFSSDEFDYVEKDDSVPLIDFMEQLDLHELSELVLLFYDVCSENGLKDNLLERMRECNTFIGDLCAIRNAAAHGRPIIPAFMDPDYNGNWDFEFDNVDMRSSVEKWALYSKLRIEWEDRGLGLHSKEIINTLYGNPIRRAWIELHYLYFYIIRYIEKSSFDIFISEAQWFLSQDNDTNKQLRRVNICKLRLSDMGNTTLGCSPTPYDEISGEAFSVWKLFNGDEAL